MSVKRTPSAYALLFQSKSLYPKFSTCILDVIVSDYFKAHFKSAAGTWTNIYIFVYAVHCHNYDECSAFTGTCNLHLASADKNCLD